MQKFIALYCMPVSGLEAWEAKPKSETEPEEKRLQAEWGVWIAAHKDALIAPHAGVGKTKRVGAGGVVDAKNEVMLYSLIQAENHDAAAALFVDHPHLQIPGAWIDVSSINELPSGM